jgi:MoaA/NifB/PqqE/SkfB family radical SAM enzyme
MDLPVTIPTSTLLDKHFCTVPWSEVHINADGTYHTCGAQPNTISNTEHAKQYNVFNMPINEWINSQWQQQSRQQMLSGQSTSLCNLCYHEESVGGSSKRQRELHKHGIDDRDFFNSVTTSRIASHLEFSKKTNGASDWARPTSYHLSLGNECNLACKMCNPHASSKIAAQLIRENKWSGPARVNWTLDDTAWEHVVQYIIDTENLEFLHVIGGEPLMNPRFMELIKRLRTAGRTNIYMGFTTNGLLYYEDLLENLSDFRHVDIGISIETFGPLNDLVRSGTSTDRVLLNIEKYLTYQKEGQFYVTARPTPSALTIHNIDELFRWCIDQKLDVMTNILSDPKHLQIRHLPHDIKQRLLEKFSLWKPIKPWPLPSNPRDPNRYNEHIDQEMAAIITALQLPNDPDQTKMLYSELSRWGWLTNHQVAKYFATDII